MPGRSYVEIFWRMCMDMAFDQSQVRFMNQGRSLQCLPRLLACQSRLGESAKFVINQRQKLIRRLCITLFNSLENDRYIGHGSM
jgi:hypothetical protein